MNDGDVDSIIVHWCAAFTNITGHPCSAAEPFSEMVAGTRCVLEAAATKTGQPTVSEFASIMELFDTAEEDYNPSSNPTQTPRGRFCGACLEHLFLSESLR